MHSLALIPVTYIMAPMCAQRLTTYCHLSKGCQINQFLCHLEEQKWTRIRQTCFAVAFCYEHCVKMTEFPLTTFRAIHLRIAWLISSQLHETNDRKLADLFARIRFLDLHCTRQPCDYRYTSCNYANNSSWTSVVIDADHSPTTNATSLV